MVNARIFGALALAACSPQLVENTSIVTSPRVIAVVAEPAEATPGSTVQLRALVAAANGAMPQWAFCVTRKPLAELEPVSRECVDDAAGANQALGAQVDLMARLPSDGCKLFGPEVPSAKIGEPAARPFDADSTGGYYQPLRVALENTVSFAAVRLTCGLSGVTSEQLSEFNRRLVPNSNPHINKVTLSATSVHAGDQVTLDAQWADCPSEEAACSGAETYPVFDLGSRSVVSRREALSLAFFATSGAFSVERVGSAANELATSAHSVWTAPSTPGTISLWFVLRDDRGGVGTAAASIQVE